MRNGILLGLLPAVFLVAGAMVCALAAWRRPSLWSSLYRWVALLATVAAFTTAMITLRGITSRSGVGEIDFGGGLTVDRFAVYGTVAVCALLALTVLGSESYMRRAPARAGAYAALLQLSAAASCLLVSQREMVAFSVALSLLGTGLVLLTAVTKTSSLTAEAALRQLLTLGVGMATAFYGLVLIYAAIGTTDLHQLATRFSTTGQPINETLSGVGIALVVLGAVVAVGAPPLQQFVRHSVEAAPGAIAGFTAAIALVTGVAVMTRFEVEGFGAGNPRSSVLMTTLAAVAMLWGSVRALRADTVRRLVGDLAVGQAGFLLLAIPEVGRGTDGTALAGPTAVLYLAPACAVALLAALLLAGVFDTAGLGIAREAHRGLGRRAPSTAAALAMALLALAGVPPFAGFAGRVLVAESTLNAGAGWAAAAAAVAMVLSAVAVARWLVLFYADDNNAAPFSVRTTPLVGRAAAWTATGLGLLLAGFAGPLISLAGGAATALH